MYAACNAATQASDVMLSSNSIGSTDCGFCVDCCVVYTLALSSSYNVEAVAMQVTGSVAHSVDSSSNSSCLLHAF
jgi:hypothetical protein